MVFFQFPLNCLEVEKKLAMTQTVRSNAPSSQLVSTDRKTEPSVRVCAGQACFNMPLVPTVHRTDEVSCSSTSKGNFLSRAQFWQCRSSVSQEKGGSTKTVRQKDVAQLPALLLSEH